MHFVLFLTNNFKWIESKHVCIINVWGYTDILPPKLLGVVASVCTPPANTNATPPYILGNVCWGFSLLTEPPSVEGIWDWDTCGCTCKVVVMRSLWTGFRSRGETPRVTGVKGVGEGNKEKKEGGRKGEGIWERRKGTPAIITPFVYRYGRWRPQILIGWSDNRTGLFSKVSLRRVVKYFPNDDFPIRFQNQYRCLSWVLGFSLNIFYLKIIQQNIGILFRECVTVTCSSVFV